MKHTTTVYRDFGTLFDVELEVEYEPIWTFRIDKGVDVQGVSIVVPNPCSENPFNKKIKWDVRDKLSDDFLASISEEIISRIVDGYDTSEEAQGER